MDKYQWICLQKLYLLFILRLARVTKPSNDEVNNTWGTVILMSFHNMHVLSKSGDSSLSKTKDTTICWSRDFVMMWPPFKEKWSMDSFQKAGLF